MFRAKKLYLQSKEIFEKQLERVDSDLQIGKQYLHLSQVESDNEIKFQLLEIAEKYFKKHVNTLDPEMRIFSKLQLLATYKDILVLSDLVVFDENSYFQKMKTILQSFPVSDAEFKAQLKSKDIDNTTIVAEKFYYHAHYYYFMGMQYAKDGEKDLSIAAFEQAFDYFQQEYILVKHYYDSIGATFERTVLEMCKENLEAVKLSITNLIEWEPEEQESKYESSVVTRKFR